MRLKHEQIEKLSLCILQYLKEKDLIQLKAQETRVLEVIKKTIQADFQAEDKLDTEVEILLQQLVCEVDAQLFQRVELKELETKDVEDTHEGKSCLAWATLSRREQLLQWILQ